jgi:hypothetical protein
MNEQDRDFSLTWIDQQIERPTELLAREDARLVQDLHAMYAQENARSLDQVWLRMAQRERGEQPGSEGLPIDKSRKRSTRSMATKDPTSAPSWVSQLRRPLSMIAAVLIFTVLVGSLLFILNNVTRGKATLVGSAVKTATPVPQVNCWPKMYTYDDGTDAVCLKHEETPLNVTTTFEGFTVTVVAAHADPSRLIIRYTVQSKRDLSGGKGPMMEAITTADGLELSGGTVSMGYDPETKQGREIAIFDNVQKPARTTIDFTVPFHNARHVATPKQTVFVDGTPVTLDHVIVTESETLIWLKNATLDWLDQGPDGGYSLSGNGWNVSGNEGGTGGEQWTANGRSDGPLIGSILTIDMPLLDKQGVWTLTLRHGSSTGTFHFTPA